MGNYVMYKKKNRLWCGINEEDEEDEEEEEEQEEEEKSEEEKEQCRKSS